MASILSKEPVCRKKDCLLIDISTEYRVICSFTNAKKFWFISCGHTTVFCPGET